MERTESDLGREKRVILEKKKEAILDVRTHFKPTETFQYTNFYLCHPPGVTKGFIRGEALLIATCVADVRRGAKGEKTSARIALGKPETVRDRKRCQRRIYKRSDQPKNVKTNDRVQG